MRRKKITRVHKVAGRKAEKRVKKVEDKIRKKKREAGIEFFFQSGTAARVLMVKVNLYVVGHKTGGVNVKRLDKWSHKKGYG